MLLSSPALTRLAPDRRHDHEKEDLSDEADNAAARRRHHERHAHQSRNKQVDKSLLFIDRTREQQSERQSDRELHVTSEVVTIDKRTKRGALVQLAKLGGYLARARDPPPGNIMIWRVISRLTDIELGVLLGSGAPTCG